MTMWRGRWVNFNSGGSFEVSVEQWAVVFRKYLFAGKIKQYESPCRENQYKGRIYLHAQHTNDR